MTTFERELETHGKLVFPNKGVSMMPLLRQDRDLMVIEKRETYQKYDAVLFLRENGQYVLHRILKIQGDRYWIVGDNCVSGEWVRRERILGLLTAVVRDGKTVDFSGFAYRMYVKLWCAPYPLRFFLLRCRNLAGRVIRKLRFLLNP